MYASRYSNRPITEKEKIEELFIECEKYRQALELISCPERSDGTFNRDRKACQLLAQDALKY